jgi:aldose 1-epimerase
VTNADRISVTMSPRPHPDDQHPAETTPATGDQWVIGHGHQRAVITEVGATLRSFTVEDRPVIDGFGPLEWSHGGRGQVLAPWPNRLGDGRYTFEGTEGEAPLNEPAARNAIHGLVRWLPWTMASRAQNRVTMACALHPTPGYPFTLGLQVEYRLGRDGLTVLADAENRGPGPLPFGLGFHPYFTVGTPTVDTLRLTVPATGDAAVAGTEFDFTHGRVIGTTRLDTGFTGLRRDPDGCARVNIDHPDGNAGVTVWVDGTFTHLMVYTGDTLPVGSRRRGIAVEPMTCPPDAFRSGTDVVVLPPGGRWAGTWGISAR